MLTINKKVSEFDGDEVVVKMEEDQFGKYHVKTFVAFNQTKHFEFDNKDQAEEKYQELI